MEASLITISTKTIIKMTIVFRIARKGADVVSMKNDVINKPKTNTITNNKNHINLTPQPSRRIHRKISQHPICPCPFKRQQTL